MDCMWHGRYLALGADTPSLSADARIPADTAAALRSGSNGEYLQNLAELALVPTWTLWISAKFEPLFVDFCNRWMSNVDETGRTDFRAFCALSRLLPLRPELAAYASEIALSRRRGIFGGVDLATVPEEFLGPFLLALYRCLRHDRQTFSPLFNGPQIQALLRHERAYIRFLALKVKAIYLGAADAAYQIQRVKHVGDGAASGPYDAIEIDYRYLDWWEKRTFVMYQDCKKEPTPSQVDDSGTRVIMRSDLLETTVVIGRTLQPVTFSKLSSKSALVTTSTTELNLEGLGAALTRHKPVLLTGLPGSGKSALIKEIAHVYGKESTMLTLHLNEQTDAKLLIGMYTSAGSPGSFKWQPGVLTTAVREGRWALIEDLDRAPSEVMSTLLPLMERRQLYVPNLGGSIAAHPSFKLFATIRSSKKGGSEPMPITFLGARHWNKVHIAPLDAADLKTIITEKFPLLTLWSPRLLHTYEALLAASDRAASFERQTSIARAIGPSDLFKCCRRVAQLLEDTGAKTGTELASEVLHDNIFLEVVDCFAGFAPSTLLREHITRTAAMILELPSQRVEHCLKTRVPRHELADKRLRLGRVSLQRRQQPRSGRLDSTHQLPFAYTNDVLRKMEALAAAVRSREPCLLVGETGTGKTTAVQELAKITGHKLIVVNLSQQSEAGDLLGGYKPLNLRTFSMPLKDEFDDLFAETVTSDENERFNRAVRRAFEKAEYAKLLKLWREAVKHVTSKLPIPKVEDESNPAKRRRLEKPRKERLRARWDDFSGRLNAFEMHIKSGGKGFAFHFVEGNIVRAVRNGDWVLLDEINLASPDTLESLADLLTNDSTDNPSLILTETGDVERISAHPDFRIFAAMNPATDVGKRDLPLSLRSRFTEFYMTSPDRDPQSLLQIIEACLSTHVFQDPRAAQNIRNLYLDIVKLEEENKLVDGANQRPHYSLRTLTRTLAYVLEIRPLYGLRRSLYEGFSMSFLTLLDRKSASLVSSLIEKHILPKDKQDRKAIMNRRSTPPTDGKDYVQFEHYWLRKGPLDVGTNPRYIITKFIRTNLLNLVRAASTRRFPVLLQGPTSSGKTSMVEYLAKISGNSFVRINNHEHTDLQEYLGTYVTDNEGNLRFQEGLLVQALRQGHWIVLDELNLAPTDILEALNRLLDDNRELFIPETQEVVRPHANFMLFATQNPAGLYGGRKALSRAFRNRFLELHFDDIPENELEEILEQRTQIAPSHAKIIIQIYRKLAELRQSSRLFEQKSSFATLRDLFRWALRNIRSKEDLATHGYMLLAERVRDDEEREAVRKTIQEITKIKLDPSALYASKSANVGAASGYAQEIVWTPSMRRIYVLVTEALTRNEPVLLVGGTGCGKTSVCQVIAELAGTQLHIVNAHQNTETGDLIGAQRPIRNRAVIETTLRSDLLKLLSKLGQELDGSTELASLVATLQKLNIERVPADMLESVSSIRDRINKQKALFEWSDGSLVQAMKEGTHFLLDEISLAEDSVLERLNSVLESGRTILLAEKGPIDSLITATPGFQFLATMNPGGDFGKRELSPALRNRFTEIWVPPMSSHDEIAQIADAKLTTRKGLGRMMVAFATWFGRKFNPNGPSLSIRDILAWTEFVNTYTGATADAVLEGAAMVYIDALGANPAANFSLSPSLIKAAKDECLQHLDSLNGSEISRSYLAPVKIRADSDKLHVNGYTLKRHASAAADNTFSLQAPTTATNLSRVVRALQLKKPILLEGSPGVGKTTLVSALAQIVGTPLTRINLSEQTDLMDLFGSDVPVEGGKAGQFAWRDAPFLQAMKRGEWVLLDEMNLASQSVLEGLNACLDHRGEVFVPELDQTFARHDEFTIFAAQNPHSQGGGRKGLPASFVNRFTVVYADALSPHDLQAICAERYPQLEQQIIQAAIAYVVSLSDLAQGSPILSASGGPWEFNLRDVLRWLDLVANHNSPTAFAQPEYFQKLLFLQRLRAPEGVSLVENKIPSRTSELVASRSIYRNLNPMMYQTGLALVPRQQILSHSVTACGPTNLPVLESLMIGVMREWPVLLVGQSGSGKTSIVRHLAAVTGQELLELPLSADMDTMDIVGGYEQADPQRLLGEFQHAFHDALRRAMVQGNLADDAKSWDLCKATSPDAFDSAEIEQYLASMISAQEADTIWTELSTQLVKLNERLSQDLRARFEWTDGILIEALLTGKWLVLDNANLCSSSVLDRLNSLLEPNGFLAINEHKTADGSARIVRPHPNFRLFLTMDPRHGELSRAMRNRCLELFMSYDAAIVDSENAAEITDSSLFRLQAMIGSSRLQPGPGLSGQIASIAFDHFAFRDLPMLDTLPAQFSKHVLPSSEQLQAPLSANVAVRVQGIQKLASFHQATFQMYSKSISLLGEDGDDLARNESLHPMNNSMLLSIVQSSGQIQSSPQAFAALLGCFEAVRGLGQRLHERQHDLDEGTVKVTSRLDRSLMAHKVLAFSKDDTAPLAGVLQRSLATFEEWLSGQSGEALDATDLKVIHGCRAFLADLLDVSLSLDFDNATFQAFLVIGQRITGQLSELASTKSLLEGIAKEMSSFRSKWQLETGHGMDILWNTLRPSTPRKQVQRDLLHRLESLMSELSSLLVGTTMPYVMIAPTRTRILDFCLCLCLEEVDFEVAGQLLSSIEEFIQQFKVREESHVPHFLRSFQGLTQLIELQTGKPPVRETLALAACRPLQASLCTSDSSEFSQRLHRLRESTGVLLDDAPLDAVRQAVLPNLLVELESMEQVPMGALDGLQNELTELPLALVEVCKSDHSSPFDRLKDKLLGLHQSCLDALGGFLGTQYAQRHQKKLSNLAKNLHLDDILHSMVDESSNITEKSRQIQRVFEQQLSASLHSAQESGGSDSSFGKLAESWISFFVGCLILYIPDKPFDPALELSISVTSHRKRRQELETRSKALWMFEDMNGIAQATPRIQAIAEEIAELGDEPHSSGALRPAVSRLNQLNGDFNNIRIAIVERCKTQDLDTSQLRNIAQNIGQAITRLHKNYRDYDDIIQPAILLLTGLRFGIELATVTSQKTSPIALSKTTRVCMPMVGLTQADLRGLSTRDFKKADLKKLQTVTSRLLYLQAITVDASVSGTTPSEYLRTAQQLFDDLYNHWTRELAREQKEHAAKSSLYRYQDPDQLQEDAEATTAELKQLFPTYDGPDDDETQRSSKTLDPGWLARQLADLHSALFAESNNPDNSFVELVQESLRQLSAFYKQRDLTGICSQTSRELLPSVFLSLEHQQRCLSEIPQKSRDFYRDSNVPEVRKVLQLSRRIRSRFQTIHEAWPEQASPMDVLKVISELMMLAHTDPVAKVLTKTEQLHSFVYQWEQVASREFSASSLYTELTDLLVSWRRLELSSWATVLDVEDKTCKDDAKAWWFIAYETIVAASLSTVNDKHDFSIHVQGLVETLAQFMKTTPIGQFKQRLSMIQDFEHHVKALIEEQPALIPLDQALVNFTAYYYRYENLVGEKLRASRQDLDKKMKEIILLTSWKDTNIEALKTSSKNSHARLFKIIRKYRSILAEPVDALLSQDVPFETAASQVGVISKSISPVDTNQYIQLQQAFSAEKLPKRFLNIDATLRRMKDHCKAPELSIDVASYLDSWVDNFVSESSKLQKETPKTLTEDNKADIQHLKRRKRALFADVLKDLRTMGFVTNVNTQLLEAQSSTTKVLATADTICSVDGQSTDDREFFKVIDNLEKIRAGSREYSDDLDAKEVDRSLTYLYGLVDLIIAQRKALARQSKSVENLKFVGRQLRAVSDAHLGRQLQIQAHTDLVQSTISLRWLPIILRFSSRLLSLHDGMGGISTTVIQQAFEAYSTIADQLATKLGALQGLPVGLTTIEESDIQKSTLQLVQDIQKSLDTWDHEQPWSSFATTLVRNWFSARPADVHQSELAKVELDTLEDSTVRILDKLLVVHQNTHDNLQQLPQDEEQKDWLFGSSRTISKAVNSMQIDFITASLKKQLDGIGSFESDVQTSQAAAFCAFINPFFTTYQDVCHTLFDRSMDTYRATTRTTRVLSDSFRALLNNGFCGPRDDSKGERAGQDKLEDGTGLGEGEGAEDISKDIQDDEDLSELAQSKKEDGKEEDEIEDEDNAVDMADQDLEGKMDDDGEAQDEEEKEGDGEDENDEQGPEEELGDVGNDDPEAVDEKLWDGDDKEDESENQNTGDQKAGRKDDQMAGQGDENESREEDGQEELSADEDMDEGGEEINDNNVPSLDPHLEEEEKLDLPDDIEMDADQKSIADESDLENMDDMDDGAAEGPIDRKADEDDTDDPTQDAEAMSEGQEPDEQQDGKDADMDAEPEEGVDEEDPDENLLREQGQDTVDAEDQMQGDTDGLAGTAEDEQDLPDQPQTETGGTQGQQGAKDESNGLDETEDSEQQAGSGAAGEATAADDSLQDSAEAQAFKKLGDALEKFQRSSRDIRQAQNQEDNPQQDTGDGEDATEFEHLPNEDAETDTQALGNADEEQAKGLEEGAMDIDQPAPEAIQTDQALLTEQDNTADLEDQAQDDLDAMDLDEPNATAIGQRQPQDKSQPEPIDDQSDYQSAEEDIQELDNGVSQVHIEPPQPASLSERSAEDALQLWQQCEHRTNDLAMSLTEQLRLILAPTLATKMRGDFRTGKRLNIKRIIPYIASQYKRDKIWMRRSIPSKRNYQIMLAVDDSKSMDTPGGGGSGQLAFETLALVSRSLSMLEAGQLCVLSFGQDVKVAHSFEQTFSSSAGASILQNFQFQQDKTDVRHLVDESLRLFREARAQNQNTNAELWQLELIISDGMCDDHESIRQMVRQAHQERIMMVFIIVDAMKGTSISSLTQYDFEGGQLKEKRYLDEFPFDYYLIVGDIGELPAVLATALRQWFSEIADT